MSPASIDSSKVDIAFVQREGLCPPPAKSNRRIWLTKQVELVECVNKKVNLTRQKVNGPAADYEVGATVNQFDQLLFIV